MTGVTEGFPDTVTAKYLLFCLLEPLAYDVPSVCG